MDGRKKEDFHPHHKNAIIMGSDGKLVRDVPVSWLNKLVLYTIAQFSLEDSSTKKDSSPFWDFLFNICKVIFSVNTQEIDPSVQCLGGWSLWPLFLKTITLDKNECFKLFSTPLFIKIFILMVWLHVYMEVVRLMNLESIARFVTNLFFSLCCCWIPFALIKTPVFWSSISW